MNLQVGRVIGEMVGNNLGHLAVLLDIGLGTLHLGPGHGHHGLTRLGLGNHHTQLILACSNILVLLGAVLRIHDILGVDPDPDPRIHASDSWIRIRILLFSSLTFKMPEKN
jgi:hypothetical protein